MYENGWDRERPMRRAQDMRQFVHRSETGGWQGRRGWPGEARGTQALACWFVVLILRPWQAVLAW